MTDATYTLITGASSGIGKELAAQAAAHNKNVIIVAEQSQPLEKVARDLAKRYGVEAVAITQDLSKPGAAQALFDEVKRRKLAVDALINDAGIGAYGPFAESDVQRIADMLSVNAIALTQLTRLFLPELARLPRAHVMNVASVAGFLPGPYMSVYFATKHYVLAFSEGLRAELGGGGVKVTCLCPPPVQTPFVGTSHIAKANYMATTKVTPAHVAAYGYRAMQRGKAVAVYTLPYKILTALLVRITPRFALRRLLLKLNTQGR